MAYKTIRSQTRAKSSQCKPGLKTYINNSRKRPKSSRSYRLFLKLTNSLTPIRTAIKVRRYVYSSLLCTMSLGLQKNPLILSKPCFGKRRNKRSRARESRDKRARGREKMYKRTRGKYLGKRKDKRYKGARKK